MSTKKRERFERLAPKRVNAALLAIERVGRCGNRVSYEFTEPEVTAMFDALDQALVNASAAFDPPQKVKRAKPSFALPTPESGRVSLVLGDREWVALGEFENEG